MQKELCGEAECVDAVGVGMIVGVLLASWLVATGFLNVVCVERTYSLEGSLGGRISCGSAW